MVGVQLILIDYYSSLLFFMIFQVMINQNAGDSELIVANKNHKKHTKFDLVYFDESPDYCVRNLQLGM